MQRPTDRLEDRVSTIKRGPTQEKEKLISDGRCSLADRAMQYGKSLWKIKLAHRPESFWYPYGTLRNIQVLEEILNTIGLDLLSLCRGPHGKIADIGAGDGDLAFFLEETGLSVDVIENPVTNFNALEGARIMKEALGSSVAICEIDLDSQFPLSTENYDAIFFLGILYHLKNPFFVLERLAQIASYCFVSTRVASHTADGLPLSSHPLAYLLDPEECNNDNTNFWIFSDRGLKRLVSRAGWSLVCYGTVGNMTNSTPNDPDRDQRAFCTLRSKALPWIMALPNPVPKGEAIGRTTILWNAGAESDGKVYVSRNGGEESLFAAESHDSCVANWIQTGSSYEFRLYNSDHAKLLDKVVVSKATQ